MTTLQNEPLNDLSSNLLLNRHLFDNPRPHNMKTNNKLTTLDRQQIKMTKSATFGPLPSRVKKFTLSNLIPRFKLQLAWPKLSC